MKKQMTLSMLYAYIFTKIINPLLCYILLPYYVVQERLRTPEHLQDLIYIQVCIVIFSGKTEVLQLDIFDIRPLCIEYERRTLEFLILVKRKRWMQFLDDPVEVPSSQFYILSQNLQHLRLHEVISHCQETLARVLLTVSGSYMKVVSAVSGLLSSSADECSEVSLVW